MLELAIGLMLLGLLVSGLQVWRDREVHQQSYKHHRPLLLKYLMAHKDEYPCVMGLNVNQVIQNFERCLEQSFRHSSEQDREQNRTLRAANVSNDDADLYQNFAQTLESSLQQVHAPLSSPVEQKGSDSVQESEQH